MYYKGEDNMCQNCTTNHTETKEVQTVIPRIAHIRASLDFINQPFLGFHRAGGTGIFTLTYAYEILNNTTEQTLQLLRFDVTALEDLSFDLLIADRDNNVLHDINFKNALEVRDFIKSLTDIKEIPMMDELIPVKTVNLAVKNGFAENEDVLISHLLEQDKTQLTVYLGLGGVVTERPPTGGHVH